MAERLSALELSDLEKRYTAEPVPPCRVCGDALSIASMGGGNATKFACSLLMEDPDNPGQSINKPGRIYVDEHYRNSTWTQYRSGDSDVLALIAEVRERRAKDFMDTVLPEHPEVTWLKEHYIDALSGGAYDPGGDAGEWIQRVARLAGLDGGQ